MTATTRGVRAALLAAVGLAVLTRVPAGSTFDLVLSLAVAGAAVVFGLAAGRDDAPSWALPAAAVSGFALLLPPVSADAVLAAVPDLVVALVVLAYVYLLYRPEAAAPRLSGTGTGGASGLDRRAILVVAVLGLVAVLPSLFGLIWPSRIADTYALTGAAGPLVAAIVVGAPIVVVALLRDNLDIQRRSGTEEGESR